MKTGIIVTIIYVALVILPFIGWAKCVIKLCQCDFEPSYKAEIIYAIGTFSGVGAIIGYFDFGK